MSILFHITTPEEWNQTEITGVYVAASLKSEGFIHCSKPSQVAKTANKWFKGRQGLLLVAIDESLLQSPLKYEAADNDLFPHLYGPLHAEAVVHVFALEPMADGTFQMPLEAASLVLGPQSSN